MGKAKRLINNIINPEVEGDITSQTLQNLQTMFAGQRNAKTDLAARTNLGADAQGAQQRGLQLNQGQTQNNVMMDLQKFFSQLKIRQAGLWLQNKEINKQAEANDQNFWANLLGGGIEKGIQIGGSALGLPV